MRRKTTIMCVATRCPSSAMNELQYGVFVNEQSLTGNLAIATIVALVLDALVEDGARARDTAVTACFGRRQ